MRGQHIITRDVLDVEEVITRGHLAHRDNLPAVLRSAWRVHKTDCGSYPAPWLLSSPCE